MGQHRGTGVIRRKRHRLGSRLILFRGRFKIRKGIDRDRHIRRCMRPGGRFPVTAAVQKRLIIRPLAGIPQIQGRSVTAAGAAKATRIIADDQLLLRFLSVHRHAGIYGKQIPDPAHNGIQQGQRHIRIGWIAEDITVRYRRAPLRIVPLRVCPGGKIPIRVAFRRHAGIFVCRGQGQHRPGVGHERHSVRSAVRIIDPAAACAGSMTAKAAGNQIGGSRPAEHHQAGRRSRIPPPDGPLFRRGLSGRLDQTLIHQTDGPEQSLGFHTTIPSFSKNARRAFLVRNRADFTRLSPQSRRFAMAAISSPYQ